MRTSVLFKMGFETGLFPKMFVWVGMLIHLSVSKCDDAKKIKKMPLNETQGTGKKIRETPPPSNLSE